MKETTLVDKKGKPIAKIVAEFKLPNILYWDATNKYYLKERLWCYHKESDCVGIHQYNSVIEKIGE